MLDYNEPQKAKVIEHIKAIIAELEYLLHDGEINTSEADPLEIAERGYIIEEYGRILDKLSEYDPEEEKTLLYNDGLNAFGILTNGEYKVNP